MSQFSIAQLEALVGAVEKGGGVDTSQYQSSIDTSYAPPKLERGIRRQVYDLLWNRKDWMSRGEIATALKLKKTLWLNTAIEGLVTDGKLVKTVTTRANGMSHFWYAVAR